ncbi:MAG TPA: chitobiase/beta-hexosaminidase C-terminal domain-containing protein, partial [Bacteroidia bacterium]
MQRGCGNIFLILFAWLGPAHAFAQPIVQTPTLDRPAGYYPDSVFVNILCANPGAALHYTLNGDEPTLISPLYTQPLLIKDRASVPNSLSLIPTNPGFNFPVPGYDSGRADDRGWLPPYDTVNKCTVLKVKAFLNGYLPSKTVTATYFIGAQLNNRYPFPVISISADSMDLFSDSTGLFVYGNDTADKGNFAKPRFEKEIYFEYFDTEGNRMLSQHCGMQIHGHGGEY